MRCCGLWWPVIRLQPSHHRRTGGNGRVRRQVFCSARAAAERRPGLDGSGDILPGRQPFRDRVLHFEPVPGRCFREPPDLLVHPQDGKKGKHPHGRRLVPLWGGSPDSCSARVHALPRPGLHRRGRFVCKSVRPGVPVRDGAAQAPGRALHGLPVRRDPGHPAVADPDVPDERGVRRPGLALRLGPLQLPRGRGPHRGLPPARHAQQPGCARPGGRGPARAPEDQGRRQRGRRVHGHRRRREQRGRGAQLAQPLPARPPPSARDRGRGARGPAADRGQRGALLRPAHL
mmetsp:Transcript_23831/g.56782  ORF Transcript_23831/g.56782 Transcript_23831/m.56782 type:complete len:288 (-) Transcript_23831:471-1334(-)